MLKPTTRQLIESFRYRRLAYLPKPSKSWENITRTQRQNAADWAWIDRKQVTHDRLRKAEINALPYRKHLASLHSTHEG